MFSRRLRTGILPAALVSLLLVPVAANSQSPTAQQKNAQRKKSQAQIEMENFFQTKLDKPVALPDVPDMGGGAKFRFGLERTDRGITSIGQRFSTGSSAQQVIDFYKQSLLASKWKLSSVSTKSVQATMADKQLIINIMPRSSPEMSTDFMLNYSYSAK